jgi:hypothetical protein
VALAISGGPVSNAGFFVAMPQRQIIAYGSRGDRRARPAAGALVRRE